MDGISLVLGGIRVMVGFLLLAFIPGFLLSLVLFPRIPDLSHVERLVLSVVISIGSVILYVLFMDVVLGIDTTPSGIAAVIAGFSLLLGLAWIAERFLVPRISGNFFSGRVRKARELSARVLDRFFPLSSKKQ